jgi:hypothetical protein
MFVAAIDFVDCCFADSDLLRLGRMRLTAAVATHAACFAANVAATFAWIGTGHGRSADNDGDDDGGSICRPASLAVLLALMFAIVGHLNEVCYPTLDGNYGLPELLSAMRSDCLIGFLVYPLTNLILQATAVILLIADHRCHADGSADFVFCMVFVNACVFGLTNGMQIVACVDRRRQQQRQQEDVAVYVPANPNPEPIVIVSDEKADGCLSTADFARLPTQVYDAAVASAAVVGDVDRNECRICYQPYDAGDSLTTLACMHRFHEDCIRVWLTTAKDACPYCRANALPPPIDGLPV